MTPEVPPPDAAASRGAALTFSAVWSVVLVLVALITRELAYICSVPPPLSRPDQGWLALTFLAGVAGMTAGLLRVAPVTAAGRLGAVTLSATLTSMVVLAATPVSFAFDLAQRLVLAGVGTTFLSLPAAWLGWGIAELGGLAWRRARR